MLEVLKKLYGDVVTEESLERFKEELGKKFVPKADFNQRGEEVKELKNMLAEKETELAGMQEAIEQRKALEERLLAMQDKYETELLAVKQEREKEQFAIALDIALKKARARNLTAVKALLDTEAIHMENGEMQGLSEQLAKLKQEEGYLFEAGDGNIQFIRPAKREASNVSPEDFLKMGYMERLKLKKEQPDLYQAFLKETRR